MSVKPKHKKVLLIVSSVILVLCLIPMPMRLKDGGTVMYCAVLYKVVVWHQLRPAEENQSELYRVGVDFYPFPFNLFRP